MNDTAAVLTCCSIYRSLNMSYTRDGSPSQQQRAHAEDTPPGGSSGQLAPPSGDHVTRGPAGSGRKNVHNMSFPGYRSADMAAAGFSNGRTPTEDVSTSKTFSGAYLGWG